MTRPPGSLRGVDVRLLEPVPRIDGQRLDMLVADGRPRLELAHYMFMLLTATEIELLQDQWHELCLPRRSGPKPTAGSDVANKHRHDLERICRVANLTLAVKPKWRIEGQFTVDTRMLMRLVEALGVAVRQREVTKAVKVLADLRHWGQHLKKDGELPGGWPLAKLVEWVRDTVPKDIQPGSSEAEEFRQRAVEVSGLGQLEEAVRHAKTDLPRRIFGLLLEEERFDEAADVLTWIDPTYEREHELRRRFREREGAIPGLIKDPTWAGISGGPSDTVIATPTLAGVVSPTPVAVGLGGTMTERVLKESAARVMDELVEIAGRGVRQIVVGCAGYDPDNPSQLLPALVDAVRRRLRSGLCAANDGDLLLFAPPLLGNGVALIADMGSVVVGRTNRGAMVRRGGDEWLLADAGSGYEIASHTLREVHDTADQCELGVGLDDDIARLVEAARHTFGVPHQGEKDAGGRWCRRVMKRIARSQAVNWDKSLIASYAAPVLRFAEAGNATALRIVEASAVRLGRHLADVLAWHPDEKPRVVVAGSVVANDLYFEALVKGARDGLWRRRREDRYVDDKMDGLSIPTTTGAADARVENPAVLFAELARMLDENLAELKPAERAVVTDLKDPDSRSRSIVEYIPPRA